MITIRCYPFIPSTGEGGVRKSNKEQIMTATCYEQVIFLTEREGVVFLDHFTFLPLLFLSPSVTSQWYSHEWNKCPLTPYQRFFRQSHLKAWCGNPFLEAAAFSDPVCLRFKLMWSSLRDYAYCLCSSYRLCGPKWKGLKGAWQGEIKACGTLCLKNLNL